MDGTTFLDALYALCDFNELRAMMVLSTFKPNHTLRTHTAAEAIKRSSKLAAAQDVYYTVGLVRDDLTRGRGEIKDIVALPAVFADLDVGDSAKRRFNSTDHAIEFVDTLPLKPSALVHSGGGVHAYWFLGEVSALNDKADRDQAAAVLYGWGSYLRKKAADEFSVDLDSVFDLARVLRLPGTLNHKHDPPMVVSVIRLDPDRRYASDQIKSWAVADEPVRAVAASATTKLVLDSAAYPPHAKFAATIANDERFRMSWLGKRPDLDDQSPSAYDFSLVKITVLHGWTDQEIANLIIAFRRERNWEPEKALRADYIERCLAKARSEVTAEADNEELRKIAEGETAVPDDREKTLRILRNMLGLPIVRWMQHGNENSDYVLHLEDGIDVVIGSVRAVTEQRRFRDAVYERIGRLPKMRKEQHWAGVLKLLAKIREVVEERETSRSGRLSDWAATYVQNCRIHSGENWSAALPNHEPFVREDTLWIHVRHFHNFTQRAYDPDAARGDVLRSLRSVGAEQKVFTARTSGGSLTRNYWGVPLDVIAVDSLNKLSKKAEISE